MSLLRGGRGLRSLLGGSWVVAISRVRNPLIWVINTLVCTLNLLIWVINPLVCAMLSPNIWAINPLIWVTVMTIESPSRPQPPNPYRTQRNP